MARVCSKCTSAYVTPGLDHKKPLPRGNGDLDRGVRSEIVAIRGMMLGDAPLCLTDEVKAAILGQVSEVANEVRDRMLVARAAMLLKSRHGFSGPGNVARALLIIGELPR